MTEKCILMLKTKLSGQTLERLLTGACAKSFSVAFDGVEHTVQGEKKIVKISFDIPEDRDRFRMYLRRLADAAPSPGRA